MRSSLSIRTSSAAQTAHETAQIIRVFEAGDIDAPEQAQVNYEAAADALLAANNALGHNSGIYTSVQLNRKMRLEQERLQHVNESGLPEDLIRELVEQRIDDLINVSNLSPMQEVVFRLHLGGMGWKSMAAALDLDRRLIKRHLRKAARKIQAAYEEGPYAGWYEVYLSEVNRTT